MDDEEAREAARFKQDVQGHRLADDDDDDEDGPMPMPEADDLGGLTGKVNYGGALLPGCGETLRALHEAGKKLVVLSNTSKRRQALVDELPGRGFSSAWLADAVCSGEVCWRALRARGGGAIVLVGSIMADFSAPTSATYSSSKCAVRKLGEVMARELGPLGIRVNVLQPGHRATAVERSAGFATGAAERAQGARIPLGRMGTAADIGKAAAFLCSDAAAYVTGATLNVDGGYTVALDLQAAGSA